MGATREQGRAEINITLPVFRRQKQQERRHTLPKQPWFPGSTLVSRETTFTELVAQEIGSQLKSVSRGNTDVAAVLALVRSESTSDVYLYGHEAIDERYPKHSPDASFAHAHSQYPSVVIETSYSQQQKE